MTNRVIIRGNGFIVKIKNRKIYAVDYRDGWGITILNLRDKKDVKFCKQDSKKPFYTWYRGSKSQKLRKRVTSLHINLSIESMQGLAEGFVAYKKWKERNLQIWEKK